ncbi:MAG: hypothetical protein KatS3mg031_0245 [Chitinophagales bacterium]|nr:MAG: hypothetical protein KatS3mg031_0245 [Chitinophagales bacterium]
MGTSFLKSVVVALCLLQSISFSLIAGDYVHRVIFVNEGYYDYSSSQQVVPVTAAWYDPATKTYAVFDTISGARFATQVIVAGQFIFVAADTLLVKYDRYSLQRLGARSVPGIRGIAAWNDKVIVTRGEIGGLPSYFQVYNQSDLSLDYELTPADGPQYAAQDIIIQNDKAYFIINNGFDWSNLKGLVGVVDLNTKTYVLEYDLGPDGLNPDNLMLEGNTFYTLNNKDFTGSSVSMIDPTGNNPVITTNLANVSSGCGTSTFFLSRVWYQHYSSQKLFAFNPATQQISDSFDFQKSFYGLEVDTVNNYIYATSTDYVSTGTAYVYDASYALVDSFAVGVAAGNIAFDIRKTTAIGKDALAEQHFTVFPNPAREILNLNIPAEVEKIEVYDLTGKLLMHESGNRQELNVQHLPSGYYQIVVKARSGERAFRTFIKE